MSLSAPRGMWGGDVGIWLQVDPTEVLVPRVRLFAPDGTELLAEAGRDYAAPGMVGPCTGVVGARWLESETAHSGPVGGYDSFDDAICALAGRMVEAVVEVESVMTGEVASGGGRVALEIDAQFCGG